MKIHVDRHCPEFNPLTRWQRFKERWFKVEPKRTRLVYKVGDTLVCAARTYELIKDSMMITYRDGYDIAWYAGGGSLWPKAPKTHQAVGYWINLE